MPSILSQSSCFQWRWVCWLSTLWLGKLILKLTFSVWSLNLIWIYTAWAWTGGSYWCKGDLWVTTPLKKTDIYSPNNCCLPLVPQGWVSPPSMMNCWWAQSCAHNHSCSEFMSRLTRSYQPRHIWPRHVRSHQVQWWLFAAHLPILSYTFCPFFCDVPWALEGAL